MIRLKPIAQHLRAARLPFGAALAAVALLASGLVLAVGFRLLAVRRTEAEGLARIQSRNLAQAVDMSLTGTLEKIDLALGSVVGEVEGTRLQGQVNRPRLGQFLATEGALLPWPGIIWITDARGRAIVGNHPVALAPPWGEREWFEYCRTHPGAGLVMARPNVGFLTKQWIIPCVRRYNLPDGAFGGVVVIPLSVDYLQRLLAGYDLGPGGTLIIRDGEGGFITRFPKSATIPEPQVGDRRGSKELSAFIRSGAGEGRHFAESSFDHVPRMYATWRLKHAPLILAAGLAEQDYLAQWRRDRLRLLAAAGAGILGIGLAAWILWRSWLRQDRHAQALLLSEERLRLAMDATSDGIWDWNVASGEVYYSRSYSEMLGYDAQAFAAQAATWAELIIPEDRARVLATNEACIEGAYPSFEVEYRMKTREGSICWILGRGKAIARDAQGRATRLVGTHVDITQRKRMEEALREAQAQLQQSQKMDSLGTLSGGIAHDMNNVLGAILGMAELGLEDLPPESQGQRSFVAIIRAVERAAKMVKGLLSFARQSPAETLMLDVNEILREEVGLLARTTLARVRLDLDLADDLRPIHGDVGALTHAFMNLCVNAVDAMSGQGTLTLRTRNGAPGWIEVLIEDTGRGMTREVLDRALDPFFTTKEVGKGTGLGLSMVYSTVKAHGGDLSIQSEPGQGTRVCLRFPSSEYTPGLKEDPEPWTGGVQRSLNVLLVDDDDLPRNATLAVLASMGHRTLTAPSGEEALVRLEEGFQPDVVILDLNMPGLGGTGTLPRLRTLLPEVPVLLSSGRSDQAAVDLAHTHAFVSLLPKPFTKRELHERLAQLGPG